MAYLLQLCQHCDDCGLLPNKYDVLGLVGSTKSQSLNIIVALSLCRTFQLHTS